MRGLSYFLRRNVEGHGSEVDLLVGVDARHHEEEAGAFGASGPQPTQAKDNRSLVFLNHLLEKQKTFLASLSFTFKHF